MARTFDLKLLASDPLRRTPWSSATSARARSTRHAAARSPTSSSRSRCSTTTTRHLFGAREFARMKPTAYFINVSRGPVVDEPALIEALRGRRIAGAALDVFEQEPVDPANPLLAMDNVIVTPHALCWTDECFHNMASIGLTQHRRCARRAAAGVRRQPRGARASAGEGVAAQLSAALRRRRWSLLAVPLRRRGVRPAGPSRRARPRAREHARGVSHARSTIGVTTLETDLAVTRDDVVVIVARPALNPPTRARTRRRVAREPGSADPHAHARGARALRHRPRQSGRAVRARTVPSSSPPTASAFPTLDELFALAAASASRCASTSRPRSRRRRGDDDRRSGDVRAARRRGACARPGMEKRVTVQSFDWRTLVAVKKLAPEIATACLTNESGRTSTPCKPATTAARRGTRGSTLADARRLGAGARRARRVARRGRRSHATLTPRARSPRRSARGLRVLPWTVNDPADMARLVDWGVDGLITDYPDRARKVLADKGIALP